MGIKPSLDDSEKAVIVLLNKQKMSISEIIRKIGRSHAVIAKYIKDSLKYGKKSLLALLLRPLLGRGQD
ncbi:hypothetical protein AAJ76_10007462 [Vairimorpha ceranae]|uniref:Tc3 transposase DNA binding domain-containing protein n=1 Tax=Vairimorpha ceranae TaxID=40302 RepID=A0A0F9WH29_9MICR|nr:hypothetical protein AAJ76_10007462 [Vairimorpha ceranae]KKO76611.1 hypothetical protein AAJ76_10007462 [Vairimorpha ceranae]